MRIGWLSTPTGLRRLRIAALVLGSVAALLMVVVGCTSVTNGTAKVDADAAPAYRASITSSIQASEASSSAQESERQASLVKEAIRTSCEALSVGSADSINAVNDYIRALNDNASDAASKAAPAVQTLNHSADVVSGTISDSLSQDLKAALYAWVDSTRSVAAAINGNDSPADVNSAIGQFNDSKTSALALCNASY